MWRALLANGRTVDHDGSNTVLPFIDEIIRFDLVGSLGTTTIEPPVGHRIVFCKERIGGLGVDPKTIAYKVGLMDRDSGKIVASGRVVDGVLLDEPVDFSQPVIDLYASA